MKTSLYCLLAGVSLIAVTAAFDAEAKSSKPKSNHSWSGGIEVGISTDRNAGSGGGGLRGASSAKDDDEDEEDEDEDEDEDDVGDEALDDLDLEDDDFADDVEDAEDEADADGEDEDLDGDGIVDGTESDDSDGDGVADGDEAGGLEADADGFELRRMGRAVTQPKTLRDERATLKANVGHKYKMGDHQWKSGASYVGADQRDIDKNDNYILAMSTGPEFKLMKGDLTLNPSVAYARLNKNSKHVFDTYATAFGAKYKINKMFAVKGKYVYSMQNFAASKPDDVYGQKWTAGLAIKPYKNGSAEVGYGFKTVDVTPLAKEKDQHEIKAKYQHDFPYKIYAVGEVGYKWTDFDAAASRRVPIRHDEEYTLGLSLGKEIYKDITLELQYDHRDAETNIRNKDTSNDRFALVGAWKF